MPKRQVRQIYALGLEELGQRYHVEPITQKAEDRIGNAWVTRVGVNVDDVPISVQDEGVGDDGWTASFVMTGRGYAFVWLFPDAGLPLSNLETDRGGYER